MGKKEPLWALLPSASKFDRWPRASKTLQFGRRVAPRRNDGRQVQARGHSQQEEGAAAGTTIATLLDLLAPPPPPPPPKRALLQILDLANVQIESEEDFKAVIEKIPDYRIKPERVSTSQDWYLTFYVWLECKCFYWRATPVNGRQLVVTQK